MPLLEVAPRRPAAYIGAMGSRRTPEEVAVSVAAEIVALRWGGSGVPLTATSGVIHPPDPGA